MAEINVAYLCDLANDSISDNDILKYYFKYYVAQGRNIGDMKHDYMRICNNSEFIIAAFLTNEQIKLALNRTKTVLDNYLIKNFNCHITDDIEIWKRNQNGGD